jgi:hypothetical protein
MPFSPGFGFGLGGFGGFGFPVFPLVPVLRVSPVDLIVFAGVAWAGWQLLQSASGPGFLAGSDSDEGTFKVYL